MENLFHLPLWMSPSVAHSHEILLKLAAELPKQNNLASYFINSEEPPYNPRSDAPKNRNIWLGLEIDENGFIKQ